MTRTMYDSITSGDIPLGRQMVAGYVDGTYAWTPADWARHLSSTQVRITVTGATLDADVADVENGDLTAAQGADWVKRMLAAGKRPTLYFSASRNAEIDAAVSAAGVGPDDGWMKWSANWTGVVPGAPYGIAEQYANPGTSGGHYDLSLVADYWPGVDPVAGSTGSRPASLAGYTTANLLLLFASRSTAAFIADFGQAGYDYVSALYHAALVPAPAPAPAVTLAPLSGAGSGQLNIDAARVAWARLGDLAIRTFPDAILAITAAVDRLKTLP
jgi:hypothetical protein